MSAAVQISVDDDGTILLSIPPSAIPLAEMVTRALGRAMRAVDETETSEVNRDVPPVDDDDNVIAALRDADGAALSVAEVCEATGRKKGDVHKALQAHVKAGRVTAMGAMRSRRYMLAEG